MYHCLKRTLRMGGTQLRIELTDHQRCLLTVRWRLRLIVQGELITNRLLRDYPPRVEPVQTAMAAVLSSQLRMGSPLGCA